MGSAAICTVCTVTGFAIGYIVALACLDKDVNMALTVMKNGNDTAHLKGWAMSVVRDLEKSFPMWDGEKKKRYAVAFMRDVADARKIKITDASLGNLVESAVRRVKRK